MDPSRSLVLGPEAARQFVLQGLDVPSLRDTGRLASPSVDQELWAWVRAAAGRQRTLGQKGRSHDLIGIAVRFNWVPRSFPTEYGGVPTIRASMDPSSRTTQPNEGSHP